MSKQTSFTTPIERAREVIKRCARLHGDAEHKTIAVSGGTDSIIAADIFARLAPEHGLEPDSVTHINTGMAIPQSKLAAQIIADIHNLDFIEQGYRNQRNSIAWRVLERGWPAAYGGLPSGLGHGREWANRKNKPMDEVYMLFEGLQIWVSGARKEESKRRSGSMPDSGVEKDKPRRVWCQPILGWTSSEKREYIRERGLPVSEAYEILGFSGECVGCAFDETGLLTNIDLLCPELTHAIRTLAVWLGMRAVRGDVDIDPKQLCWGWDVGGDQSEFDPNEYETFGSPTSESDVHDIVTETAQAMVGCDEDSCSTRERPEWILELPEEQMVRRRDVVSFWASGKTPSRFPV